MSTQYTQRNDGWNAEPNAQHTDIAIDGTTLTLSFLANQFQFPGLVDG